MNGAHTGRNFSNRNFSQNRIYSEASDTAATYRCRAGGRQGNEIFYDNIMNGVGNYFDMYIRNTFKCKKSKELEKQRSCVLQFEYANVYVGRVLCESYHGAGSICWNTYIHVSTQVPWCPRCNFIITFADESMAMYGKRLYVHRIERGHRVMHSMRTEHVRTHVLESQHRSVRHVNDLFNWPRSSFFIRAHTGGCRRYTINDHYR